jgi:hypothetical protein
LQLVLLPVTFSQGALTTEMAQHSRPAPRRHHFALGSSLQPLVLNAPGDYGSLPQARRSASLERPERPLRRADSFFHIQGLVDDRGGNLERYRQDMSAIKHKPRKIRRFYEKQNALRELPSQLTATSVGLRLIAVDDFAEVDAILDDTILDGDGDLEASPLLPRSHRGRDDEQDRQVKIMIGVNFAVKCVVCSLRSSWNPTERSVLLLAAKIIVVLLSGSISLIASTVDSAMDFISTLIIVASNHLSETRDWQQAYDWPVGRKRMEPVRVLPCPAMRKRDKRVGRWASSSSLQP